MKKILKHPFFLFLLFVLICYFTAEFIIRGEALNRISFGTAGWFFWGGVAFLVFRIFILPVIQFASFPAWHDPNEFEDPEKQHRYLRKYTNFLFSQFGKNPNPAIAESMEKLKIADRDSYRDPLKFRDEAIPIIIQIHRDIEEKVCGRIIRDYMRRTALIVMISQRGLFDSAAMLIMQFRLIIELSKAFGQRPTWISISSCMLWVIVNSFFFALFDGTDFIDEATREMLPVLIGENTAKGIPFFSKVLNIAMQGITSMAIIYATGKTVQMHLLGRKNKLSGKERIKYRLDGYKEAFSIQKQIKDRIIHASPSAS